MHRMPHAFWMPALILGLLACGEEPLAPSSDERPTHPDGPDLELSGIRPSALGPGDLAAGLLPNPSIAWPDDGGTSEPLPPDDPPTDPGPEPLPTIGERCFADIDDPTAPGPDYDQFSPVVADHCAGTAHQAISGIERVVFVGDSITVGSPPTLSRDFYRSLLADRLADRFGLRKPSSLWKSYDPMDGTSLVRESGDFASCAKWGARTDDLIRDNQQLEDCLPENQRQKRTLVVMTVGGNDISNLTRRGAGRTLEENWAQVEEFVDFLREAIEWLKTPGRFPNGVHVVFANMYEFTDGTGDLEACDGAEFADLEAWDDPEALEEMIIWANEQYMSVAVETGTDMIFMLEHFCGHGFRRDDPTARCYRGPDAELYFDLTCIHPNEAGHQRIADLFMSVVEGSNGGL